MRPLSMWMSDNRERRHSTIAYLSPIDYEQQFIDRRNLDIVMP